MRGPRYWHQHIPAQEAGMGDNLDGGPLNVLYRSGTIYVQRKACALSYMEDPTGVRSRLSHMLRLVRYLYALEMLVGD